MQQTEMNNRHNEHMVSYRTLVTVWLVLLVFTALTVAASLVNLGPFNVWLALGIATIKASLVLAFFMHLKYEPRLFTNMFFVVVIVLALFIGLLFFDVSFR